MSTAGTAVVAAREAAEQARRAFVDGRSVPVKLAVVFASLTYEDVGVVPESIRAVVGDVPIVGGSAGACVLGPDSVAPRGVSVVLLGGDDLEIVCRPARLGSADLVEVVPAAQEVARAADDAARRGLPHYACLVFGPGIFTDGEALVAAVRKGAGARAQLAGGLTGDEMTMDRPKVWVTQPGGKTVLCDDHAVVTGIFTRKHIGIAARHGWQPVGPTRTVTRADGPRLIELDHRPALGVWLEDARKAGAVPPAARQDLLVYLANHYEIGIVDAMRTGGGRGRGRPKSSEHHEGVNGNVSGELVARAPWRLETDGSVMLSGSIGEGRRVRVVHASRKDLLKAATNAAADAVLRAGSTVAGALVLACSGRLAALGDAFPEETSLIRKRVAAPIGGACVFGEIAKTERDVDAFFNTTAVIVAFGA